MGTGRLAEWYCLFWQHCSDRSRRSRICFSYIVVVWNSTVYFDSIMPSSGRHWLYLQIHVATLLPLVFPTCLPQGPRDCWATTSFNLTVWATQDSSRWYDEIPRTALLHINIIDCSGEEKPQQRFGKSRTSMNIHLYIVWPLGMVLCTLQFESFKHVSLSTSVPWRMSCQRTLLGSGRKYSKLHWSALQAN